MSGTIAGPVAGWTDIRDRWWTLHVVRTMLAILSFAGLSAAQAVDRPAMTEDTQARLTQISGVGEGR